MLRTLSIAVALALAVAFAGVARAAPENNPNAETIVIDCETLGTIEVLTLEHAANGFGPDGRVYVAKRFEANSLFTVTTFDGAVFGPFADTFEEGAKGHGFDNRLIECSFNETFTDTFTLDAQTAEYFDIPAAYIGTEVTLNGEAEIAVWVVAPGGS